MSNIKTSVKVLISILALSIAFSTEANGQVITRRQQFNLFRQQQQQNRAQQQLDQQQDLTLDDAAPLSKVGCSF